MFSIVFLVLGLLFGVRSVSGTPGVFILFYSLPSFLLVVTVSFSFVLFIVFCFNVRSQCKQTKQLSQIIQRSETSVTD